MFAETSVVPAGPWHGACNLGDCTRMPTRLVLVGDRLTVCDEEPVEPQRLMQREAHYLNR